MSWPIIIHLSKEDWKEIYYALDSKIFQIQVATGGISSEKEGWIKQLRKIIETIGPNGTTAYAAQIFSRSEEENDN